MLPDDTGEEQGGGRFQPGTSGNPAGRPPGSRNSTTLAVEHLLEGQAEALTQKAIDVALEGDARALKLCLERIAPVRRGRSVHFDLPAIVSTADVVKGVGAILTAVATGQLTPEEGAVVASVVEAKRRSLETELLATRIAEFEKRLEEMQA